MKKYRIHVHETYAAWTVCAVAAVAAIALSLTFAPWSFAWLAWGMLGYFTIVTGWRELVVVDSDAASDLQQAQRCPRRVIYVASLAGLVISVLGFFEFIRVQDLLVVVAAIAVVSRLLKTTVYRR
jgi:hypothetical protein